MLNIFGFFAEKRNCEEYDEEVEEDLQEEVSQLYLSSMRTFTIPSLFSCLQSLAIQMPFYCFLLEKRTSAN